VTGRRHPLRRVALIGLAAVLGVGSRRHAASLPGLVAAYAGDTLWALAAFLLIGLALPRASTWRVALLAMIVSNLVELSQLYHAGWIDAIRRTALGGLILGSGFVWSDLACYAVGVGLGVVIEQWGTISAGRTGWRKWAGRGHGRGSNMDREGT
jgi:hypothetical protein